MKIISWDEYFMMLAKLSAMRSKDPNTQVGAAIVNSDSRVVALGYNGMPNGDDKSFSWSREGTNASETKYPYVIHAEINALLNANTSVKGGTLYVSLFPCANCAKLLVQAGIQEIVYENNKYADTEDNLIAKKILDASKVEYRQFVCPKITIK